MNAEPILETKKYRVILADDHEILRFGLKNLLSREADIEVVDTAGDGVELLEKLAALSCDLIVLDLSMPRMDGLRVLDELRRHHPGIRVIVFTMHKEREFFRTALGKGVSGYILKDDNLDRIPVAIKEIRAGRKYFSPALTAYIGEDVVHTPDKVSLELLTRRELEVLQGIARGQTSKEIAAELGISFRTVQVHRANLTEKLGIKKTAGLVKFALAHGVV